MPVRSSRRAALVAVLAMAFAALPVSAGAATTAAPAPSTVVRRLEGLPPATAPGARALGGVVDSQPAATPIPFSMVGFVVPPGAEVSFRTSTDGAVWGPWTEAHVEDEEGPDHSSTEAAQAMPERSGMGSAGMSEGVWVGAARWLQTRVEGGDPRQADAVLIDSSGLSRSPLQRAADVVKAAFTDAPAEAATPPGIVTRARWGADERLRTSSPAYAPTVRNAVVHHTAGSNTYSRDQSDDVVRGVYAYHVSGRGWSDVGYNFLVDRFGTVFEGRFGGVTRGVIGAHAGGFNTGSFGVSMMGNFDAAAPPAAMLSTLHRLLAWKFSLHRINPNAHVTAVSAGSTKYPAGTRVVLPTISGHRNVSLTGCPGGLLYAQLPNIRAAVGRQVTAPPVASPPAALPGAIGARYASMGSQSSVLGRTTSGEYAVPGGRARDFADGRIYWLPGKGTRVVQGLIAAKYVATGAHARWGLPLTDERAVPGGRRSTFVHADIFWSPATAARVVYGAIWSRYRFLGGASSPLGLPTTDEYATAGGRRTDFQHGSISWSSRSRSISVVAR